MCYKSHCIKSNKWFIAIWPETEVGKGAGWRDFASTTSALEYLKTLWARTVFKMTDSLSSGCGADVQESCGTVFLKHECSETRRGSKTRAHSSVGAVGEVTSTLCCRLYQLLRKDLPHQIHLMLWCLVPAKRWEIDIQAQALSKQSTVGFSISGPHYLPEDSYKSPKCWNIPLKKYHLQDGQSPS